MGKFFKTILGVLTLIISLFVYDHFFPSAHKHTERSFNQKLKEANVKQNDKVALNTLTNFEWNKVCTHVAYTNLNPNNQSKLVPTGYTLIGEIPYISDDGALAFEFKDTAKQEIRFLEIDVFEYARDNPSFGCFSNTANIYFQEKIYGDKVDIQINLKTDD